MTGSGGTILYKCICNELQVVGKIVALKAGIKTCTCLSNVSLQPRPVFVLLYYYYCIIIIVFALLSTYVSLCSSHNVGHRKL